MKTFFTILNAIFRNQDTDTLNVMVGDSLGVDTANFEYCNVETQATNGGGVRVKTEIMDDETGLPKATHKFVLVPMDGEIMYRIGLALENGCEEDEQREMWGNKTIDWFNAINEQNHDLVQEFCESLKAKN